MNALCSFNFFIILLVLLFLLLYILFIINLIFCSGLMMFTLMSYVIWINCCIFLFCLFFTLPSPTGPMSLCSCATSVSLELMGLRPLQMVSQEKDCHGNMSSLVLEWCHLSVKRYEKFYLCSGLSENGQHNGFNILWVLANLSHSDKWNGIRQVTIKTEVHKSKAG